MKNWKRALALLLATLFVLILSVPAIADFGDFSDGGDYDSGDYGSDYDYDYDYDSDYDSGSGRSRKSKSNSFNEFIAELSAVLAITLLFTGLEILLRKAGRSIFSIFKKTKSGKSARYKSVKSTSANVVLPNLQTVQQYMNLDPGFNPAALREWASNLFVRMQNGWTAGDISDLRPFFTSAYFAQMESQLRAKTERGYVNYIERVCVRNVEVKGFYQSAGEDHMILELSTRFVDYTVERATGRIVAGKRDEEIFLRYLWDLSRTSGVVTETKNGVRGAHCPNCGAPLDLNTSARCSYCDSVIEAGKHDWAICRITKL